MFTLKTILHRALKHRIGVSAPNLWFEIQVRKLKVYTLGWRVELGHKVNVVRKIE